MRRTTDLAMRWHRIDAGLLATVRHGEVPRTVTQQAANDRVGHAVSSAMMLSDTVLVAARIALHCRPPCRGTRRCGEAHARVGWRAMCTLRGHVPAREDAPHAFRTFRNISIEPPHSYPGASIVQYRLTAK